ncbi:MAG: hypothetical protein JOZ57_15065 [Abitibacteriaceae bacterium]|nr:hypothetical protein [Abditibacteriaceae bacterium]
MKKWLPGLALILIGGLAIGCSLVTGAALTNNRLQVLLGYIVPAAGGLWLMRVGVSRLHCSYVQQQGNTHSITIELSDSGGYQVVA